MPETYRGHNKKVGEPACLAYIERGFKKVDYVKKFFLCLLVLIVAGGGAAYFAVPPLVENAVRQNLEQMPAVLNQPGRANFSTPEIGKINFEPVSRTLTIEKTILKGVVEDGKSGKINMVCRIGEVRGTMPWRLLFLISPMRNIVSEEYGFETVLSDFLGKDVSLSLACDMVQVESAAEEISGKNIMLQANVLGSILDNLPLDSLDIIYGLGVDDFLLKGIGGNVTSINNKHIVTHKLGKLRISDWRGQTAKKISIANLAFEEQGRKDIFSIEQVDLDTVTLPEMPLMVALKNDIEGFHPVDSWYILRQIMKGKPIVSRSVINNLQIEDYALKSAKIDWLSNNPSSWNVSLAGLSMPIRVLEEETGLNVVGLEKFDLDADLAVEEGGNSRLNHKGSFRAPGLGVLAYEFSTPSTPTNILTMMATQISGFSLDYADGGLVARLAAGIAPNAQAAMFALKIAAGHFCSQHSSQNEKLRQAIEGFVEQPGNLVIRARKPFSMAEVGIQAYRGDLGSIFEATATPGTQNLEEAMKSLRRQANK